MDILDHWHTRRGGLGGLSEEELRDALQRERDSRARETVLVAIHRRYSRLRTERERAELRELASDAKRKRS